MKNHFLYLSVFFCSSSMIYVFLEPDERWFSRLSLAGLFFCTYAILTAIEGLKK